MIQCSFPYGEKNASLQICIRMIELQSLNDRMIECRLKLQISFSLDFSTLSIQGKQYQCNDVYYPDLTEHSAHAKYSFLSIKFAFVLYVHEYSGENTDSARSAICKLDSDEGSCDDNNQRWHYNSGRSTCQLFNWGGCAGNR